MGLLPLSLLPRELLSRHVLAQLQGNARRVSRAFRAGLDAGSTSLQIDLGRRPDPPADLLVQLALGSPELKLLELRLPSRLLAPIMAVAADVLRAAAARCQLQSLTLTLNWSQVGGLSMPLGEMSSLTQLELVDTRSNMARDPAGRGELASMQAVVPALRRMPALQQLSLSFHAQLGDASAAALAGVLPSLQALQHLELGRLGASTLRGSLGSALQQLPRLRRLCLSDCELQAEGAAALWVVLRALPSLEALQLSGSAVGPESAAALASGLRSLRSLRELTLNVTDLVGQGGLLAPALQSLTGLESLDMSSNDWTLEDVASLAPALKALTRLTLLDLSYNGMGAGGAAALGPGLQPLTALRELSLDGNNLGDDGVVPLAPAFHGMTKLQHLGISGNALGMIGATALASSLMHLPEVASLDIWICSNALSEADEARLIQLFPAMQFDFDDSRV